MTSDDGTSNDHQAHVFQDEEEHQQSQARLYEMEQAVNEREQQASMQSELFLLANPTRYF